jgi:hypothetical protein
MSNKSFGYWMSKVTPRRAKANRAKRTMRTESLEPRLLFANPQLLSVNPNRGELLQNGAVLNVAPEELTFRFDENQSIDTRTLGGIQIVRSNHDGVFTDNDQIVVTPGFIGLGDEPNEVVARFASPLPDDTYRITIIGVGASALKNASGQPFDGNPATPAPDNLTISFRLDLGAKVEAVVPQPVTRNPDGSLTQARNQIHLYLNNDPLDPTLAESPAFYQLINTKDTVSNQDNGAPILPVEVDYDAEAQLVVLTFSDNLDALTSAGATLRLRVGDSEPIPAPPVRPVISNDAGDSYQTAHPLGTLGAQSQIIAGSIDPQPYRVTFPGGNDDPGSRDIPYENERHVLLAADSLDGVRTIAYNFKAAYGTDPQGNPLFNLINAEQKQRAREAFELWSQWTGVQFVETATSGITIVHGDPRVINPLDTGGRGDGDLLFTVLDPTFESGMVILDAAEQWDNTFGDNSSATSNSWFRYVMAGIGNTIGVGLANNMPAGPIMTTEPPPLFAGATEPELLYPGPFDLTAAQYIHRPDSVDIDLYEFQLADTGVFDAEIIAQRMTDSSLLDAAVNLYRQNPDGSRSLIARNDDYFSEDSRLQLELEPGRYFIGVSSTGNTQYSPEFEGSGFGGTTQGRYELRLSFKPTVMNVIRDTTGTAFDGDSDGVPGGIYNFWFRVQNEANTIFVDKDAAQANGSGTISSPVRTIPAAFALAQPGDIVRVVGNGSADNITQVKAYQVGFNLLGQPLQDGATLDIPKGVTMMVDAGAIFKISRAAINVGSSSPQVDRSSSALQILGTPDRQVIFTSYNDEAIGVDTNPSLATSPARGDWGGLKFRNDVDRSLNRFEYERQGIFLNYVNHADLRYGGGMVVIDSVQQVVTPIDMTNARPSLSYNTITRSADSAMAANPDSFEESTFNEPRSQQVPFSADYTRIGPEIYANTLVDNTTNALFVRIATPAGNQVQRMTVAGRFDDTDIVHYVAENLIVQGNPGGPLGQQVSGNTNELVEDRFVMTARLDASLVIDPGIIVKSDGARIEAGLGAQLLAEGTAERNVIFTSIDDDRFGAAGTFDTRSNAATAVPQPGDWAGIYFAQGSGGSIDHASVMFGGGIGRIEGTFAAFNAVEIHQADVRITNSVFDSNANGVGGQALANRAGRGENDDAAIFVLGAQPVIVNNEIRNTTGPIDPQTDEPTDVDVPAISVDAHSLDHQSVTDKGRSTGLVDVISRYRDNQGALIRGNSLSNNNINGMVVRGTTLVSQSVWDDTDIVHVVFEQITVPDIDTYGGLRLESSASESLVVKFSGADAGIVTTGRQQDITDRIGGALQAIGQPGHPVILTSLADDTYGAGFVSDTNNDEDAADPTPGDWRGLVFDQFTNDRNVEVYVEQELAGSSATTPNGTAATAEYVGNLATIEQGGDDNRRLGFEIHGDISSNSDVDVYSFDATAGTLVWIDIDRTSFGLDSVVELISSTGQVLARSDDSVGEGVTADALLEERQGDLSGLGRELHPANVLPGDRYTLNPLDAGMRVTLPGAIGQTSTYHVRVRSKSSDLNDSEAVGQTSGIYQLQLRLREADELPGTTVRFANIRYATNGIQVLGLPNHSPFVGEFQETTAINDDLTTAQDLGNLLVTERGVISVAGILDTDTDVDWYQIEVRYENVDRVAPDESVSVVFDLDYADGLGRPDALISIFTPNGDLVLTSNDSSVSDDLPSPGQGSDIGDTSRGSVGSLDPMIGPVQLLPGTYYVAVSAGTVPEDFLQFTSANPANSVVRFEPIDSIGRIAEDHISVQNVTTAEEPQIPVLFGDDFLLLVTSGDKITEGDTVTVESQAGHKVTFEMDTEGFRLFTPDTSRLVNGETITIRSLPSGFFNDAGEVVRFKLNTEGFSLQIPPVSGIFDGELIAIQGPNGNTVVYEMDNNFLSTPGNVPVFFTGTESPEQIAQRLAARINTNGPVGATASGTEVRLEEALTITGGFGGITIDSPVAPGEVSVFFRPTETSVQVANRLANLINGTGVAAATVGGTVNPRIELAGVQDVRLSAGGGMTSNSPVRSGNFPVHYSPSDDAITVGTTLSAAINAAMSNYGISAVGGAQITITDQSGVPVDLNISTALLNTTPIVDLGPGSSFRTSAPSIVPLTLQDIPLFIVEAIGQTNNTNSTLSSFDAYSGLREVTIGPFAERLGDIDMRPAGRGELHGVTRINNAGNTIDDASTGDYVQISMTNGATTVVGNDEIQTYIDDGMGGSQGADVGILFQAMTYASANVLYTIGSRGDAFGADNPNVPVQGNDYRTNIIYRIDGATGNAVSLGDERDGDPIPQYVGAGTQIVEQGHIDTVNDLANTSGKIITTVDATTVTQFGTSANINDGMTIDVVDGSQTTRLEFETGPQVFFTIDQVLGDTIRDGYFFIVDGDRYTFDTGATLVVEGDGAVFDDGQELIIEDNRGRTRTFEFDNDGELAVGNVGIAFNSDLTQAEMISLIVNSINSQSGFNVQAAPVANRITLINDASLSESVSGLSVTGDYGATNGTALRVEETWTAAQIGRVVANAFKSNPDVIVGQAGDRVNFLGATTANFAGTPVFVNFGGQAGIGGASQAAIGILASDDAQTIAAKIVKAINVNTDAVAQQFTDNTVSLTAPSFNVFPPPPEATFDNVSNPFTLGGAPPGGTITGAVYIPGGNTGEANRILAVSDQGGLYEFNFDTRESRYVATATDLLTGSSFGGPIRFTGLTLGPQNIENGRYARTMFGIDNQGTLYAFNEFGELLPVFANGQSSLQTDATAPVGLAFGRNEQNLWSTTGLRFNDQGHGYDSPVTDSRDNEPNGGSSFHFGNSVNQLDQRNYDFPGGTAGTLISNTLDLSQYTAEDKPMLYFSYFLDTEDAAYNPQATNPPQPMRDSFRVYIQDGEVDGDRGEWHLLATNNQYRNNRFDDEFDDPNILDDIEIDVQELHDNVGWRQARIPLDAFAGRGDLRLRFEFSTAGGVNLGTDSFGFFGGSSFVPHNVGLGGTEGIELRAIPATELRDGQTFSLGSYSGFFGNFDAQTFEFDLGYTLLAPSGKNTVDGETFGIQNNAGATVFFEFDMDGIFSPENVPVTVTTQMSSGNVAFAIEQAILASDLGKGDIGPNEFTADLTDESNDRLRVAVDSGLNPLTPGRFSAVGELGDNPDASAFSDVDMIRFDLEAGQNVQIRSQAIDAISTALRLFDANGLELQIDTGSFFGDDDPVLDFTAPSTGTYYVGVSSASNTTYDPVSGTSFGGGGGGGIGGEYSIDINVSETRLVTYRDGARLNLQGAADVLQPDLAGGNTALFVDGAAGTQSPFTVPVPIHMGMNKQQVASAIADAMGSGFSGGDTDWVVRKADALLIVGRAVSYPGPLAKSDHLWGDFANAFNFSWSNQAFPNGPLRGLDNAHEGAYIDDLIIGFAERGEMVLNSSGSTTFVTRPDLPNPNTKILTGPYQLEIRQASQYGRPSRQPVQLSIGRTFDTNDRLTESVTIEATAGEMISDGQTVTISSKTDDATIVFLDRTIPEGNDTLATATPTGFLPGTSDSYIGIGQIGDNASFFGDNSAFPPGLDVDLIAVDLAQGDRLIVDVDAYNPDNLAITPSNLDSTIRVFDANGNQLFISDNEQGPEDLTIRPYFFDPAISFTAPSAGRYYIGISQSQNATYNPQIAGSGTQPFSFDPGRLPDPTGDTQIPGTFVPETTGGSYVVAMTLNAGAAPETDLVVPFATFDSDLAIANRMTRAINEASDAGRIQFSAAPRNKSPLIDLFGDDVFVSSKQESLAPESNDTLDSAVITNAQIGRNSRFVATGTIGDNTTLGDNKDLDVDLFRLELQAGAIITVDVDALEVGSRLATAVALFDAEGDQLAVSVDDPAAALTVENIFRLVDVVVPEDRRESGLDPVLRFRVPATGTYYVGISSLNNVTPTASAANPLGTYVVNYDPNNAGSGTLRDRFFNEGAYQATITVGDGGLEYEVSEFRGDSNIDRDQGQLILQANEIFQSAEWGILVDAGARDATTGIPHPGAIRNLPDISDTRLVPGVTITNNLIARSGTGGIMFSGDPNDPNTGSDQVAPVPFGRVINNTIFGREAAGGQARATTGIMVSENASPTLLNNIVSQFGTGIAIDATSATTVVGGTLYKANDTNAATPPAIGLGDFPIVLATNQPLFVDTNANNFYIMSGSRAIDSSVDSLPDRADLVSVRAQLDLPPSPILAPNFDVAGQLRIDDPTVATPVGQGSNVFKDRGALDRADFTKPIARLANPLDNDPAGLDRNPAETIIAVTERSLEAFVVELLDKTMNGGIGVDDRTVTAGAFELRRDGNLLQVGIDYQFEYDATNNRVRFSPLTGVWRSNSTYEITIDNTAINDLAGNDLSPNRLTGETVFTITSGLGVDLGDAPDPSYPSLRDNSGAQHDIVEGFYLGSGVTFEGDSLQNSTATGDIDDGVTLPSLFPRNVTVSYTITASANGFIDAWMDWSGNGNWESSERVLNRAAVVAGENVFTVRVPADAVDGTTFSRFRFSSAGGLAPTGPAEDGEVEDYAIVVSPNTWQNQTNALDVNGVNGVSPLDALLIINELDDSVYSDPVTGALPFPTPDGAPFYDVNGDGFVSPLDALLVINNLNASAAPAARAALSSQAVMSNMISEVYVSMDRPAKVVSDTARDAGIAADWGVKSSVEAKPGSRYERRAFTEHRSVARDSAVQRRQSWESLVDRMWEDNEDVARL